MKSLTKEQFVNGFNPQWEGNNILPPKIQLLVNDECIINGNKYKIKVEDLVYLELTR